MEAMLGQNKSWGTKLSYFWEYLFEFVDFYRKDIVRNVRNSILSFPFRETVMVKYNGSAT